jgi:hypothetical protein
MGKLEESVNEARLLKADENCPTDLKQFFFLNYAYSLVLYAQSVSLAEDKIVLLEEVFPIFTSLKEDSNDSMMFQKTFALALEIIIGFVTRVIFIILCIVWIRLLFWTQASV